MRVKFAYRMGLFMALALAALSSASADLIRFTVTATPQSTGFGYQLGQNYTFTWQLNANYTGGAGDSFTSEQNLWFENTTADPVLFQTVYGDGLLGTWTRPMADADDPSSTLSAASDSGGTLGLMAGCDTSNTGLQLEGGVPVLRIMANLPGVGSIFSFPEAFTQPDEYFAGLTGTYTPSGASLTLFVQHEAVSVPFTASSVSVSAIPEPATLALLGCGLALFARRRRYA